VKVVTVAGVRMSFSVFLRLIDAVQRRTREWVESADVRFLGRLNEKMIETHVRLELERALSLRRGREVHVTDKVWKCWRKIFAPAWFVRSLLDIASFRARIEQE